MTNYEWFLIRNSSFVIRRASSQTTVIDYLLYHQFLTY
jgi:hypothetical protein